MRLKNTELLRSQAYINGQWTGGERTFSVTNPFDGELITKLADLGEKDVNYAVEKAAMALEEWKTTTAYQRSKLLRNWYELMIENKEDLGAILTAEQGKPLSEAIGEIVYGASFIEWFSEEARRSYGDTIPGHMPDKRIVTIKQPVGVVATITPWNFPNAMITRKVGPALAAGCTVVAKPAKNTPLSALAIAYLAEKAGIPPGVFNVVTSSRTAEVGKALTSNPIVRKLSFTGSTVVGKQLIKECADTVKKVSMELGGNAPFIVFEDADIDKAVEGAVASKFRNAGQTCVCSNRLFVHDSIYEKFNNKFSQAISELRMGNGFDQGINIGPMIDEGAVDFAESLVKDAVDKGAKILEGGLRSEMGVNFFEPTVLTEVDTSMKIHSEEIFGPVAPVFRFSTEEEVIKMANDTEFGLAAYFYGKDNSRIWRVAEALEYGMVGINTGLISTTVAPFGGIKESGFGREGSKYGMDEYLEVKYLCMEI